MTIRRAEAAATDRMLLLPVLLAALVPIAVTRGLGGPEFGVSMLAAFMLLAPVATFSATKLKLSAGLTAILLFGGVAAGVLIDVVIDFAFYAVERNLFPLEVIYWWLLGALPIAAGVIVGHLLARNKKGSEAGS
jgi:hypothetical protein